MASDNRAYTQFDNPATITPASYGGAGTTDSTITSSSLGGHGDEKILKKWKNSRRLCWGLLGTSIATVILEVIGSIISGVHLDWFLIRFLAGIWLAALGVISSVLGLRAFKNLYESSKCWTMSHFVTSVISTIAYGIVFIMAAGDVYRSRMALEAIHQFVDEEYDMAEAAEASPIESGNYGTNSTSASMSGMMSTNSSVLTTTPADGDYDSEVAPILNAVKGNMTVSVFILATSIAFFIMSIIANVLICRQWCKKGQKTMTIVYMPQNANGQAQTQSVVIPAKTQVVVVPANKPTNEPIDHFK